MEKVFIRSETLTLERIELAYKDRVFIPVPKNLISAPGVTKDLPTTWNVLGKQVSDFRREKFFIHRQFSIVLQL